MPTSTNALTKEVYKIPEVLDDAVGINSFLNQNIGKKVVVVQGLGFVGAVMALVCANTEQEDYAVIGVDLADESSYWKIKSINDGLFPLIADDPQIDKFFKNALEKGNFYATFDPIAYSYADVIIVDINLDVEKKSRHDSSLEDFNISLKGFESAIRTIGQNCKEDALLLVETTVPPGTCERLVKPSITDEFAKRNISISKFRLGHSYERVMPGPDYVNSIIEFPRVYSGCDEESADAVESFLSTIIDTDKCELKRLEHTNASEMAKVLENSYRAMNISFVVEWSRFAEEAGVNLYSMINAIRVRDTHSNLMYPGIGVGGYCLTKDPLLASWSRSSFFNPNSDLAMSIESVSVNDRMPVYAFNRISEVFGDMRNKNVTFLGISYRGDVGDTRFTPVGVLLDKVIGAGASVNLHDPFVSHWEEKNLDVHIDYNEIFSNDQDLIIISAGHTQYKEQEVINKLYNLESTFIFDTIGLLSDDQISMLQKRHKISVLGRGDL